MRMELLEYGGVASAIKALHLPYGSEGDSHFGARAYTSNSMSCDVSIGQGDLTLLRKLVKGGDEHAKVLRGIIYWIDITAPRYWWVEMDTYRFGRECLSSESTMHEYKDLSGAELQKVKSEMTEGTFQRRIVTFSLQTLLRIIRQRSGHRLPEWHKFCNFAKDLPIMNLITKGE